MEEVARAGNIILIIQDVHNVVGVASVGNERIDLSIFR
jgi:ATP-dependent Clp protease ATP-binding subunit ClpA